MALSTPRVLLCDDQPDVLEALRLLVKGEGWAAVTVDSPAAVLRAARGEPFDLILVDLNYTRDTTSGAEGMDLLMSLEAQGNGTPVMVMTAWGSFDLAVEAMRRGACDFIQKPWDNQRLVASIRKQMESERRRRSEMEIAASVQQKLFPHDLRRLETVEYYGYCVPARTVGGDYYDFLDAGGRGMAAIVADVSGKGVPAALLMANLQAWFHSHSAAELNEPVSLLGGINRHFYNSTEPERFATMFYGLYDDETRKLRYVNCAHSVPLLLRDSGALERLRPTATVVGAFERWGCEQAEVELSRGDMLAIYSDGVTEAARDGDEEEFGEERLLRVMEEHRLEPPAKVVHAVVDAVAEFSRGARSDDVTVVALRAV